MALADQAGHLWMRRADDVAQVWSVVHQNCIASSPGPLNTTLSPCRRVTCAKTPAQPRIAPSGVRVRMKKDDDLLRAAEAATPVNPMGEESDDLVAPLVQVGQLPLSDKVDNGPRVAHATLGAS